MKTAIRVTVLFLVIAAAGFGGFYILRGVKLPTFPEVEDIVPFEIVKDGGFLNIGDEPIEGSDINKEELLSESGNVLEKMSHGAVFSYSVISDSEIYYFAHDGRVFRIGADGDSVVSDKKLPSLNGAWNTSDGKRALVSFGNPSRPEWGIFDFLDGVWRPLPTNIIYAAWGENNDTLIAIEENEKVKNLIKVNLTKGTPINSVILKNFGMEGVSFMNAGTDRMLVIEKPSSFHRGSMWEVNLKTLQIKAVFSEESGLLVRTLPDLAGIIKFVSPNKFSLASLAGTVKNEFMLKTLPEKCGGSENRFYCFVPTNIPDNIFLPDDYFKNKIYFLDALYRVDTETGEDTVLLQSGVNDIPHIDGERLLLIGERLYFKNRYDNRLYRINLTLVEKNENISE